jgi:hypothetical protein
LTLPNPDAIVSAVVRGTKEVGTAADFTYTRLIRKIMADIISLDEKLQLCRDRQTSAARKRKLEAVQKVFHCMHCAHRCAKCGLQIGASDERKENTCPDHRLPYRFCGGCAEEYGDYIEKLKGKGNPDYYWHNEAWLETWKTWIDHQGAIDRYLKTKEFLRLLNELKQTRPDQ